MALQCNGSRCDGLMWGVWIHMKKPGSPFQPIKVLWAALVMCCGLSSSCQMSRAASGSAIRVGLRTQGGPIAFYARYPLVLTDARQAGRKMTVRAGEIVSF